MAHIHHPIMSSDVADRIVNAVMHNKDTIGIKYFNKWCTQHCPKLVYWMHRHISHTLSSSNGVNKTTAADTAEGTPQEDTNKVSQKEKFSDFKSSIKRKGSTISLNIKKLSPTNSKKSSPNGSPKASNFRRKSYFLQRAASEEKDVLRSNILGAGLSKSVADVAKETCAKLTEQYEKEIHGDDQVCSTNIFHKYLLYL